MAGPEDGIISESSETEATEAVPDSQRDATLEMDEEHDQPPPMPDTPRADILDIQPPDTYDQPTPKPASIVQPFRPPRSAAPEQSKTEDTRMPPEQQEMVPQPEPEETIIYPPDATEAPVPLHDASLPAETTPELTIPTLPQSNIGRTPDTQAPEDRSTYLQQPPMSPVELTAQPPDEDTEVSVAASNDHNPPVPKVESLTETDKSPETLPEPETTSEAAEVTGKLHFGLNAHSYLAGKRMAKEVEPYSIVAIEAPGAAANEAERQEKSDFYTKLVSKKTQEMARQFPDSEEAQQVKVLTDGQLGYRVANDFMGSFIYHLLGSDKRIVLLDMTQDDARYPAVQFAQKTVRDYASLLRGLAMNTTLYAAAESVIKAVAMADHFREETTEEQIDNLRQANPQEDIAPVLGISHFTIAEAFSQQAQITGADTYIHTDGSKRDLVLPPDIAVIKELQKEDPLLYQPHTFSLPTLSRIVLSNCLQEDLRLLGHDALGESTSIVASMTDEQIAEALEVRDTIKRVHWKNDTLGYFLGLTRLVHAEHIRQSSAA
jgi:hypothetical protein